MIVINKIENFSLAKSVVALGKFDGVHLGHQQILQELKRDKTEDVKTVIITFSISPEAVLTHKKLRYIMTDKEKQDYFEACGIDYLIDILLDEKFLAVEAEDFVRLYLKEKLGAVKIVCGRNFHFGRGRRGNVDMLEQLGRTYGFEMKLVDHVMEDEEIISSTRIRQELLLGNIGHANKMMGHAYAISGVVMHGNALGRTIDFPTVNLIPAEDKILPPNGVYGTEIEFDGIRKRGITNVGRKPTVETGRQINVETNIFDFSGDLYGQAVTVYFHEFIRPEMKFGSLEELKDQIRHDVDLWKQG